MKTAATNKISAPVFAILALILCGATIGTAAPGDLDTTFSGDGKLTDFIPGTSSNRFVATAVQPDGKIVAVGGVSNPRYIYVARYNSDGSPDPAFGGGTGKVAAQFGPFYNYVSDVAIQTDGKIVVVGCYCEEDLGDYSLALARFNPDGSLDSSFDGDGIVVRPEIVGPANSVAIQTDGKIVVAGQAGFYLDWIVLRFNSDGSRDSAFMVSGNIFAPNHAAPYAVAVQTDGKIVAAGSSVYTDAPGDFAVARYNADGSLDTTFDGDGKAITPLDPDDDRAFSVAVQTDGKIVAAGVSERLFAPDELALVRYNPNGTLDTTFNGNGVLINLNGFRGGAASVAIQTDGKIVAAGTSNNGSNSDFAVARYEANGSPDTTFGGGDGTTTVDFDHSNDVALGMTLDNAGRAVIVGGSDGLFAVARFLLVPKRTIADFDGDGKTDVGIFRSADGSWWYARSSSTDFRVYSFGIGTDAMTPGDFTGDGKTDIAVFRPSNGEWYVQRSEDDSYFSFPFGASGDIPAPGDYDNDGKTDAAVFRPTSGSWFIQNSGGSGTSIVNFGAAQDKPVAADYDGDGKADIAIFRPSDGSWWYLRSSDSQFRVYSFGVGTDRPVPGDYTGDGKAEIAVFRPVTGEWFFQRSEDNSYYSVPFGQLGDVPAPGDYDGDGRFDAAVFRPSTGEWFVERSTAGTMITRFGGAGDRPVPNAFVP